ncbi:MAG TPA: hypothetical protein VE404_04950, partial [Verrucomicrobiae bacterium]|nr:hypothetical protein [Verrucomicrobiae bacterium]
MPESASMEQTVRAALEGLGAGAGACLLRRSGSDLVPEACFGREPSPRGAVVRHSAVAHASRAGTAAPPSLAAAGDLEIFRPVVGPHAAWAV